MNLAIKQHSILYRKVLQSTNFPSCSTCKKCCILHLHNNWIYSVIWFWALEYAALNPPRSATYIPHLSYLSLEHHAGTLRKHLHFHPATASQTAQTTCRRNRRDSKLQQETGHSNQTSPQGHAFPCSIQSVFKWNKCTQNSTFPSLPSKLTDRQWCFSKHRENLVLLVVWILLSVCTIKIPQNTLISTYYLDQTSSRQSSLCRPLLLCSFHHFPYLFSSSVPFLMRNFFKFLSSQNTFIAFYSPFTHVPGRTRKTSVPTISVCQQGEHTVLLPIWGLPSFTWETQMSTRGRKAPSPGPFHPFICRHRHISWVPWGKIKARNVLLQAFSRTCSYLLACWWPCEDISEYL